MNNIVIESNFTCGAKLKKFSEKTIKNEPMLFNCDLKHARLLGGPITHEFLDKVIQHWGEGEYVIDSRVHMLMPGWFPCIPGWHHDDVPRTRSDGQPNYGEGQDRSQHIICLVNGGICATDFAVGNGNFKEPELGKTIYQHWHRAVERKIKAGELLRQSAPANILIEFDDRSWHQGTPAVANGWRWFGRISRYRDKDGNFIPRRNKRTNETRRQVQVYMKNPFKGW